MLLHSLTAASKQISKVATQNMEQLGLNYMDGQRINGTDDQICSHILPSDTAIIVSIACNRRSDMSHIWSISEVSLFRPLIGPRTENAHQYQMRTCQSVYPNFHNLTRTILYSHVACVGHYLSLNAFTPSGPLRMQNSINAASNSSQRGCIFSCRGGGVFLHCSSQANTSVCKHNVGLDSNSRKLSLLSEFRKEGRNWWDPNTISLNNIL